MNPSAYEEDRLNGIHLNVLLLLTLAVAGVSFASLFYGWKESWMLPLLAAGILASWYLHFDGRLAPARRLWVYASVGWACFLLNGVHALALFDICILTVLELLLYSRTDERKFLHVSLCLYVFCLIWQIHLILEGQGVFMRSLDPLRLLKQAFFVFVVYWFSLSLVEEREGNRKTNVSKVWEIRSAQRRIHDFLKSAAQEMRAAVHMVKGVSSIAMKDGEDEQEKEDALKVYHAGKRLASQVEDMLNYIEIESGKLVLMDEPYALSSVINDVSEDLSLYEKTATLEIQLDAAADMPALLLGPRAQIEKIIKLTIDNAVKFTPSGGVYARFYTDKTEAGVNLCIDVHDSGVGMTREELRRVRQTAYQADAGRSRRAGGVGLGFPIINSLTRKLHGFANITSMRGKGTRVHICIPQKVKDDAPCMIVPHSENIRVVICEDITKFKFSAVRDFSERILFHAIQDFGLTVQRVTKHEELKKLLLEESFTHMFTTEVEYSRDPAYFDSLGSAMHVVVTISASFTPSPESPLTFLRKPLNSFLLAMMLNSKTTEDARRALDRDGNVSFEGLRALVVADKKADAAIFEEILRGYGLEAHTSAGWEEAVSMLQEEECDAVFMDLSAPGVGGLEATRRMRQILRGQNRRAQIVALSANATSSARKKFLEEGFDAFLAKPLKRKELKRVLEAARRAAGGGGTKTPRP